MRETEVRRFVPAMPTELERALDPGSVVAYEGSFDVFDIEERSGTTLVTAGARGLRMTLRFDPHEDGFYYEQEGDAGPFDEMWTTLTWDRKDEGVVVTARSGVSLGLPFPALSDRVAAWKRRGELDRLLDRLADDLG
ncbi:MAG: SRPBCC family protein [Halolamina sp.]|uniref:SRPBCC family protein n=1 Tax=Halolamina sp. TaxID=1940283 RepID=UPI002FC289EC